MAANSDERARAKKDMARRARRLALMLVDDEDRQCLLQFAKELDAEAEAFERGSQPLVLRIEASFAHHAKRHDNAVPTTN